MGRKPGISAGERLLRAELADELLRAIGTERGAQSRAAETIGIKKQALSLYLRQKSTPGADALRKIITTLNLHLPKANLSPATYANASAPESERKRAAEQLPLFEAISEVGNGQLDVRVLRKGAHSIDLKVSINFKRTG